MHGHRRWSCKSTLLHSHITCVWGDIPIGLGTSVVTFKRSVEVCQISGECINHFHHIHHLESSSWPFDCSTAQFLFSFLGPVDLWSLAFFNALSLWQFGLVCPWSPQWWQKCCVLEPLYDFGSDFPLPLGLTTDCLGGLVINRWSVIFFFFSDFTWSTFVVATISSLAFTNFISLVTLTLELL